MRARTIPVLRVVRAETIGSVEYHPWLDPIIRTGSADTKVTKRYAAQVLRQWRALGATLTVHTYNMHS